MQKSKNHARSMPNTMGKPPYHDAQPPRMGRNPGKGPSGDTFRVPSGAKYGTGEGVAPTRMDRSGGKGKTGSTFRQGNGHAAKSSRKDTGANTDQPRRYGVEGVSVSDVGSANNAHGGVTVGGGTKVAGSKNLYGGS